LLANYAKGTAQIGSVPGGKGCLQLSICDEQDWGCRASRVPHRGLKVGRVDERLHGELQRYTGQVTFTVYDATFIVGIGGLKYNRFAAYRTGEFWVGALHLDTSSCFIQNLDSKRHRRDRKQNF
jgi:hypothetical protein